MSNTKFTIDFTKFMNGKGVLPSESELVALILENNPHFSVESANPGVYVYCENKPRDLPEYGMYWVECNLKKII